MGRMSPQCSTFFVKIRQILKRIFVISYIFTNGNVVDIMKTIYENDPMQKRGINKMNI